MIELIKNKLNDKLIYFEQEKCHGEYINSYILEVEHKDEIHYVGIYHNQLWCCSIFDEYVFYEKDLNDLLDRLFDELEKTD